MGDGGERGAGRGKVSWRPLDGVLLLDKPSGITSTAALARARRAFRAAKAGHTGTLDPLASGLLPLCFGEATKFASDLLDADKCYEATMLLGVTTETGDAEGAVTATRPVDVDRAAVDATLDRFRGPITQIPPMYSALKRDGRPLYEYARSGITVERAPRVVTIHRLEVLAFEPPLLSIGVRCSKGTYIRTLAEDIGHALGCGAHLTALRRTGSASLVIADAIRLDRLEAMPPEQRDGWLLPVDRLIAGLPSVMLDPSQARRFIDGQAIDRPACEVEGRVRVYRAESAAVPLLLGTGRIEGTRVLPVRLVATGEMREA